MSSPGRQRVSDYLSQVRKTLRLEIVARGIGWTCAGALVLTCVSVAFAHNARFSDPAVRAARTLLFGGTLGVIVWLLIRPLMRRYSDAQLARFVEEKRPEFRDRLVTAVESQGKSGDPITNAIQELQLEDAMRAAERVPAESYLNRERVQRFAAAGAVSLVVLFRSDGLWSDDLPLRRS